jgi:hypothetical protein
MQKKLPIENTNTHKNLEFKNLGGKTRPGRTEMLALSRYVY